MRSQHHRIVCGGRRCEEDRATFRGTTAARSLLRRFSGMAASRLGRAELQALSRDELIEVALNGGVRPPTRDAPADAPPAKKPRQEVSGKKPRAFDMSRYSQRHIALRVAYIGTAYSGFAYQSETPNTVEGRLLDALKRICLITDRESCGISCGGRTDKGVSALGQAVALRVRSNLSAGLGVIPRAAGALPEEPAKAREEMDYCRLLNKVLPEDIRVLAWQPTAPDFSARFSATQRTYKYFFSRGHLDVRAMETAARQLLGEHDFRNFCKVPCAALRCLVQS